MVNWKASESTDRLIAVLIAAHPGLKGHHRVTARAERHHKQHQQQPHASDPARTTRRHHQTFVFYWEKGQGRGGSNNSNNASGMSFMEAIFLDDGLSEEDKKVKSEAAEILTGLVGNSAVVYDLTSASTPTASSASITSMKMEDAAESFSSAFGDAVKQEGRGIGHVTNGDIDVPAIEHDGFDMAGLYFHGHGGYGMDDIYGGAA
ncbi:hypothetical protein KXW31_006942 [Aspergillus fumigatus]|nr:hypothetical protein KXW31_006942 [Aspergillus fumigatus]